MFTSGAPGGISNIRIFGLPGNYYHRKIHQSAKTIQNMIDSDQRLSVGDYNTALLNLWQELKNKIPTGEPGKAEFIENFIEIEYKDSTQGRSLIRYILTELEYHEGRTHAGWDENRVSIEHIVPRRPSPDWNLEVIEVRPFVNKIGNLAMVSMTGNSTMNNGSFSNKLETYREEGTQFALIKSLVLHTDANNDSQIDHWDFNNITSDNYTVINERSKEMAEIA